MSSYSAHALAIWEAGVQAVRADLAMSHFADWNGRTLRVGERHWTFAPDEEVIVVGAGKGTTGMLKGFMQALRKNKEVKPPRVRGWINVPEGTALHYPDCPSSIRIHEARPQGINEPTQAVVEGTNEILNLVQKSNQKDIIIALISGGGSALLCSPIDGITLETKIKLTKALSSSGADIRQLNAVRRCLSRIKGGGLARATSAQRMATCILSDVLGDPLEFIASGPTILKPEPDPIEAIRVLDHFVPTQFPDVRSLLESQRKGRRIPPQEMNPQFDRLNFVIANNAAAVDAAGQKAVDLGYRYWMNAAKGPEGDVLMLATQMAHQIRVTLEQGSTIDAIISGGEPTVTLPTTGHLGKGGRNQQLALGVLCDFCRRGGWPSERDVAFLSGGTDGEDGPTNAAGALVDRNVYQSMLDLKLDPEDYLSRCDAYRFFEQTGGLIMTGPTQTNVCDLRVAVFGTITAK
jgi:glycerate 2-kinase